MAYQQSTAPGGVLPGHDYENFTDRKKRRARRLVAILIAAAAALIGWALLERFAQPAGSVPEPKYEYRGR